MYFVFHIISLKIPATIQEMKVFIALLLVTLAVATRGVPQSRCSKLLAAGLSSNYNESIAHAIHSMTVQGLQLFNPRANDQNTIPTVNHNLHDKNGVKVLPYAPNDALPSDYFDFTMNMIDKILSMIGKSDDGLGAHWSSTERIVHKFHMRDLWLRLQKEVRELSPKPLASVCKCVLDVKSNGIFRAVEWIAAHYESGTPITLLDRPIPKLVDSKTWEFWKNDLLHYYTPEALHDAAVYLHCATKDF
ncbi:unnamed protein product [Rotaria socialis]|uniref:Uncharacterized protein n=1 Tax=Rotaria socialis TaxID=392032 RepID=A0A817QK11_9BILA|nr:unnamed protein product [Rotaria socialis]CAF3371978.1 unnamed protein product [Rotaria socialis]CAF3390388.1 unnamed protein product [Rotaria socialis]CAF3406223.1 unnamed protein product [Rotaria socialis]CAF4191175.1 unnamed protein product [Rotaria socialis]